MVAMAAFAAASELYLPIILCVFTSRSVRHFETFPLQRRFYCSVGNLSPIPQAPRRIWSPGPRNIPPGLLLIPSPNHCRSVRHNCWKACRSSTGSLTAPPPLTDHQILQVRQPRRRWLRLSISTSGRLHSKQY